jgi:fatty acid desaturase
VSLSNIEGEFVLSSPPPPKLLFISATANVIRNVWSYAIIFCGHFPDQTYTFTEEDVAEETRGGWYVRQLTGAANIDGGPLFHVVSGNLGYQFEHHLYPDMPSTGHGEIAPRVREICMRYGLPHNSGPFHQQLGIGPADDPPPGAARRQAATQAGGLRRSRGSRQGRAQGAEAHLYTFLTQEPGNPPRIQSLTA